MLIKSYIIMSVCTKETGIERFPECAKYCDYTKQKYKNWSLPYPPIINIDEEIEDKYCKNNEFDILVKKVSKYVEDPKVQYKDIPQLAFNKNLGDLTELEHDVLEYTIYIVEQNHELAYAAYADDNLWDDDDDDYECWHDYKYCDDSDA